MSEAADVELATTAAPPQLARSSLLRWLHEGARTLLFRAPRWERLRAGPAVLAALLLLAPLLVAAVGRLYASEGAVFQWRALLSGWTGFLLIAWACYVIRPAVPRSDDAGAAPGAAHLLCIILAQALCLTALYMASYAALSSSGLFELGGPWLVWASWVVPMAWRVLALLVVMLRSGARQLGRRLLALAAVTLGFTLMVYLDTPRDYWSAASADTDAELPAAVFTQASAEGQAPLLAAKLAALAPQRPGIADMYTLTFAPYEGEEVFRRESRMVSEVMAKRFDAGGRALQLINHAEEVDTAPWATALNLQRAIAGIARTMDRNEDLLFIHLTSHGADNGELAASFWPLEVEAVTPADLRRWLDQAGIRHRVISISACYAGNWITPMASADTLVMTASDADHTSFGCGRKSPLTFFGRAMFDEQLRSKTLSFEQAHAAARLVIAQREKDAGKDDGYSNPQIKVGANIRPYLQKMQERLASPH